MNKEFLTTRPLSFSSLKEFHKSPKHYIAYLTKKWKQTPDMLVGSALHCKLLEPEKYSDRYAVAPECDKRGIECKSLWAKFAIANEGKDLITQDQQVLVDAMLQAVKTNAPAWELFNQIGQTEAKKEGVIAGLPFVGYIDALGDDILIDLKSCQSSSPREFMRDAYNNLYHLQAAIYHKLTGVKDIYFIAVEKSEPYNVTTFRLNADDNIHGENLLAHLTDQFNLCMDLNQFDKGYEFHSVNKYEVFQLPRYAQIEYAL